MAKRISIEAEKIARSIEKDKLAVLHKIRGDASVFRPLIGLINQIIFTDKEKIVGLTSDTRSIDEALNRASKQNFYRGRISSLVLFHALMENAEKELERREKSGS